MKTLFLGSGYTGNYFRYLYPYSIHSSRSKDKINRHGGGVLFDANRPETWESIGHIKTDAVIISFPLDECNCLEELNSFLFELKLPILIIGTTSAFLASPEGEIYDDSPLNTSIARNKAEELFRKKGASVIYSAGIYGKGRNPVDWLRKGYIKNSALTVNLIHAEDLARACNFILENFSESQRYLISDNRPQKWADIISFAVKKKYITALNISSDKTQKGKIVKPEKIFEMGFNLRHPDIFEEIQFLESLDKM